MAICAHIDATTGALIPNTTPITSCSDYVIQTSSDWVEYTNSLKLVEVFTFDLPAFELAFGAMLLLFITGFGIGLILAQVRKARVPT